MKSKLWKNYTPAALLAWLEQLAVDKPVELAFGIAVASAVIVIGTSWQYWTTDFREFLKNVAVEAHGMVFDLIVIGWLILWLNKRAERRMDIRRYKEEIDDYRNWKEEEAAHRIAGNIRRLNKNGITQIHLRDCFLEKAALSGVSLNEANLMNTKLSNADLRDADLRNANLSNAQLTGAKLSGAILINVNLNESKLNCATLSGADLSGAVLRYTSLSNAQLIDANLSNAQLIGAQLIGANLNDAILISADLSGSDLRNARLSEAQLIGAKLDGATFINTILRYTNLRDANLRGSIFLSTNLTTIEGLTKEHLEGEKAPFLCNVALPEGFEDIDPNRDCGKLAKVLVERYPEEFKTLEDAQKAVNDARKKKWD